MEESEEPETDEEAGESDTEEQVEEVEESEEPETDEEAGESDAEEQVKEVEESEEPETASGLDGITHGDKALRGTFINLVSEWGQYSPIIFRPENDKVFDLTKGLTFDITNQYETTLPFLVLAKDAAIKSNPNFAPNTISARSFSLMYGIVSDTPGTLIPL